MAKLGTAYVKIKPEIDLSELDDDFLDALATRVAEKLAARNLPVYRPFTPVYPVYPRPSYTPWQFPYQVWC